MEGKAGLTPKKALLLAAPHTWAASMCPALFGIVYSALKGWPLHPLRSIALFVTCVLFQSAVNTLNDYADYVKGTDTADDNVEEHDSVLVYGNIAPKRVLALGTGYLGAGAVLGLIASYGAGYVPVAVGIVGGAVVALYSAGPIPISYLPAGELVSGFVMGGLIPLGITAVASRGFRPEVLIYSIPFILGIALIMMSNNGCDIEKDIRAGRHTFPAAIGRERTAKLFHAVTAVWVICIIAMSLVQGMAGIVGTVLLVALGREVFPYLRKCTLEPATRIRQMKTIVKANLVGGASYVAALLAVMVWNGHG